MIHRTTPFRQRCFHSSYRFHSVLAAFDLCRSNLCYDDSNDFLQDHSVSSALAFEILQSCPNPSIWHNQFRSDIVYSSRLKRTCHEYHFPMQYLYRDDWHNAKWVGKIWTGIKLSPIIRYDCCDIILYCSSYCMIVACEAFKIVQYNWFFRQSAVTSVGVEAICYKKPIPFSIAISITGGVVNWKIYELQRDALHLSHNCNMLTV